MLDVIIRGGRVVTPDGVGEWDVAVQGEKIVAVAAPGALTGDVGQVIDATGKLVIPGGIDPHVHTSWPVPRLDGTVILSAGPGQVSRAAIFGGTTTLVDFAVWELGLTIAEAVARTEAVWRESYADYSFHVMLQGAVPPEVVEQVPESISAGFPSFKIFMTNVRPVGGGRMIRLGHLWAVMEQAARHGGILAIHAEDDDLVMFMYDKLRREGRTDIANMPLVHSIMSEDISFRRVIRLARYVEGATLYMMHVSSKVGVDAIAEARADGYPIYGETLHHYASFTADMYMRPDGVMFHTYPSLKHDEDRHRLWSGLRDGGLNTVATDELCTPRAIKLQSRDVADATGGHVGVETRVPIIYTEGVVKRGMPLERFVAVTSSNAAKILGLYPQKGALAAGSDADIVLFDPTARKTLRAEDLHGSDYSAWEGWEVHGWPSLVMLRGKVVVEQGQLHGQPGEGRVVPRKLLHAIQDGPNV
ncbi:MAG: amidohydrolase family protein [Chloroflexi bacterium]|nr:amidohydrolase family protein [Chloroflexota bacterium]